MNPEIQVQAPDGTTRKIPLSGHRFRIGRSSADNDLCFSDDMSLSRWHLVFERDEDGWLVRDLKTKNHTFLNRRMIDVTARLRAGDRIEAGRIVIVFEPGTNGVVPNPVVFSDVPVGATVMTNLEGLLSQETRPGRPRQRNEETSARHQRREYGK